MRALDDVFGALKASAFRMRFRLGPKERAYFEEQGAEEIAGHARRIIRERLGPAYPKNDGKQTPMRGHPVFIAQHATATCCRGCLAKWHAIPPYKPLDEAELKHAVAAVMRWLGEQQTSGAASPTPTRSRQLKLDL
ncbi:MAG: DUF4186 domain-containing protein [Deltaproteobacteria bacterium]